MAYSGRFLPNNPTKYKGDVSNIIFRSLWERTVMVKLDMWDVILEWSSEELRIPYRHPLDGRTKTYFPDFLVRMKTPSGIKMVILEVKPKKQTVEPKKPKRTTKRYINEVTEYIRNQAKWEAARHYAAARGWEFMLLTEEEIYGKRP